MQHESPAITTTFTHRAVQDLAWVIHSPPLISGQFNNTQWLGSDYFTQAFQHTQATLQTLDQHPEGLLTHLRQLKSLRLGLRFEALIAYWLQISPHYTILYQNYALRHAGKTLGEMDFVIQENNTGKVIHLEVAVKFYLSFNDIHNMSHWCGTNKQDRLDKKYQHLLNHQTQLATLYPDLMPCSIDESWCLLKGRLFYPLTNDVHTNTPARADFATAEHLAGHWHQIASDSDNLYSDIHQDAHYQALDKQDWLAPFTSKPDKLQTLPQQLARAQCFAHWQQGQYERQNQESNSRLFLLPKGFWHEDEKLI